MQGRQLFEIRHGGRNIGLVQANVRRRKRYIALVNGIVCAIGSGKGEVLRRAIQIARHYPSAQTPPVTPRPKRRRGSRPVARLGKSQ